MSADMIRINRVENGFVISSRRTGSAPQTYSYTDRRSARSGAQVIGACLVMTRRTLLGLLVSSFVSRPAFGQTTTRNDGVYINGKRVAAEATLYRGNVELYAPARFTLAKLGDAVRLEIRYKNKIAIAINGIINRIIPGPRAPKTVDLVTVKITDFLTPEER